MKLRVFFVIGQGMKLYAKILRCDEPSKVVRISRNADAPIGIRSKEAFLLDPDDHGIPAGFAAVVSRSVEKRAGVVSLPAPLHYLEPGDIIKLDPPSRGCPDLR